MCKFKKGAEVVFLNEHNHSVGGSLLFDMNEVDPNSIIETSQFELYCIPKESLTLNEEPKMQTEKRKLPEKNKFFEGLFFSIFMGAAWLAIIWCFVVFVKWN